MNLIPFSESESEYSQMSDYYHDKLRLATAEQTNFTIGVNDEALVRRQIEEEERIRDEKVRQERMKLEQEIKQSRQFQKQQVFHQMSASEVEHSQADLITPVIVERATANMRVSPPKNNFDVLIRVLDEPDYLGALNDEDEVSSVLTEEERYRLREVIMTDEKIQTILKETHTTEKMLMLKDYREIGKVIHPQKWDVLIRIIDNADQQAALGRKSSEDRSSTTTYGRKTAASSMTAQELR